MKKYFAPKPAETAPAAPTDQIPATTVAPQPAAPRTEYKVGSMADLGKGIVSMADVAAGGLTGLVGQGSYAIQRAMGVSPEEAQKSVAEFVEKRTDPFGRALGISNDPAYKAEATRRLTNFIGENVGKGGIVRDGAVAMAAAERLARWLDAQPHWMSTHLLPSPIEGGDGNREFLLAGEKSR
jgi:hypothetical protein